MADKNGKLLFLFCSFFLTQLRVAGLLKMRQKKDEPLQEERGVVLPSITVPEPQREDCEAPATLKATQDALRSSGWS